MAYATGVAYYHRLPLARSIFKSLFEKLIAKMLRREVWGYWYLTSQSGIRVNPSLKELRKPWADPVVKENIMVRFKLFMLI
jgi:Linalool dehydratase/isomerase